MKPLDQADQLLFSLAERKGRIDCLNKQYQAECEAVNGRYKDKLQPQVDRLKELEKELVGLMKGFTGEIFDGQDLVKLENGILTHTKADKVSIPRDALEKIEEQGWKEAVKVAKSVDRGVVEKWPDERLVVIGAERKPVELYSYEIKNLQMDSEK